MMARSHPPATHAANSPGGRGAGRSPGRDGWLRLASLAAFVLLWQLGAMLADSRTLPDPLDRARAHRRRRPCR